MRYGELVQLYFERSVALQWYWTLYVVVIGGLLAVSSLRQRKDALTVLLVSVLYALFAYKNLGAIGDVTRERLAVLTAMKEYSPAGTEAAEVNRLREKLEPTLTPTDYEGVRNFHLTCDVLTVAALWAMEWRRRRAWTAPGSGAP
jgi:hypothetical protein